MSSTLTRRISHNLNKRNNLDIKAAFGGQRDTQHFTESFSVAQYFLEARAIDDALDLTTHTVVALCVAMKYF